LCFILTRSRSIQDEQARLVKLRQSQSFPSLLDEADAMADKQVTEDPPELLATIPSVTISDLDKHGYEPPILIDEDRGGSGVTVLLHEVTSSFGLVYADLGIDISMLDFDDIFLLPTLARLMVDAGTETYSDVEIAREVGANTGGISGQIVLTPILPANATTHTRVTDGDHFYSKLFLRGAASMKKSDKLLELLSQIMFQPRLDSQERALGVLREAISDMETNLATGGTHYAMSRIAARYSAFSFVTEEYRGVSRLPKLREILEAAESDWGSVLERLQNMMQKILKGNRNGMILNLTGEKEVLIHCAPRVDHFLEHQLPGRENESSLPNFVSEPHPWVTEAKKRMPTESPVRNEGVVSTGTVNFVGAGGPFYEPFEEIPGSIIVVTQYIEFNYFQLQIRERRGAYGAWAYADELSGDLTFITYRDPNLSETLEVYRSVPSYLKEQMDDPAKSQGLINSAIIGSIGELDGTAPQPDAAGWLSLMDWLRGSTPELRQAWREEILGTTSKDFLDYANRLEGWRPTLGISGPKTALDKEKGLDLTLIDLL
jgi:presequence protease